MADCEEDCCDEGDYKVVDFKKEATQSLAEVSYAIREGSLSGTLDSASECVYLNITTLEGELFCVRLSWRGFEVVGRVYDDRSGEETCETAFETVYSLLDHISPSYRTNFHRQIADRLDRIQQVDNPGTEALPTDP